MTESITDWSTERAKGSTLAEGCLQKDLAAKEILLLDFPPQTAPYENGKMAILNLP